MSVQKVKRLVSKPKKVLKSKTTVLNVRNVTKENASFLKKLQKDLGYANQGALINVILQGMREKYDTKSARRK